MQQVHKSRAHSHTRCHCRAASVEAITRLVCLTLKRERFVEMLGPLEQLMAREKSPQAVTQRLMKLQTKGTPAHMPAEVSKHGQACLACRRAGVHLLVGCTRSGAIQSSGATT